jgi:hypothetical protein
VYLCTDAHGNGLAGKTERKTHMCITPTQSSNGTSPHPSAKPCQTISLVLVAVSRVSLFGCGERGVSVDSEGGMGERGEGGRRTNRLGALTLICTCCDSSWRVRFLLVLHLFRRLGLAVMSGVCGFESRI